jgi:hypothetical protein
MAQKTHKATHPIADIPKPETIKRRLKENQRERSLLKQLLKVAERAAAQAHEQPEIAAR